METSHLVICYDLGTTANKTCLYRITDKIELVDSFTNEYPLYTSADGSAEQDAEDWWKAICEGTKKVLSKKGVKSESIEGIAFCTQLQGSILVDKEGNALHRPMIWLDGRATDQIERHLLRGLIKIEGFNIFKALPSTQITGGIAGTAKDPLWKYVWVKEKHPEIFAKTYKWCDVKDYLLNRCTGKIAMTYESAHLTWVFDTRPGHLKWSKKLCRMFGVNMDHLPNVVASTDIVGELTKKAALEMGLKEGTPVFGGGGDSSLIPIGAGCSDLYDTHIYIGTSGWILSNVKSRMLDMGNYVASLLGAIPGNYNYIAEQETAGICLQWVRDHLALDEIGLYLKSKNIVETDKQYESLYDFLNEIVLQTPPGAGKVLFTPWLHGNRAPRQDPYVRGMFFNIGLNTGKRQMIRAVLEGVAFNARWILEAVEKKIPYQKKIRLVGGGAKSDVWCQIMADITGRRIETIDNPQNAGTIGAAIVCAVGLKLINSFQETKKLIPVRKTYDPRPEYKMLYDDLYQVYSQLYKNNKQAYKTLNQIES